MDPQLFTRRVRPRILSTNTEDGGKAKKKTGGEFRMEVNKSKVISREGQKSNPYLERVPAAPACPCAGFMSSKIRERLWVERMEK